LGALGRGVRGVLRSQVSRSWRRAR